MAHWRVDSPTRRKARGQRNLESRLGRRQVEEAERVSREGTSVMEIIRFVDGLPPIRCASLPEGPETVRSLIDGGYLHVGDIVQCDDQLAAVLPNGWLRLVARADEPFKFLSSAAKWVLRRRSANGWIEWRCLRDGERLWEKRDRWMRRAAAG